jgi:hypothetical protein
MTGAHIEPKLSKLYDATFYENQVAASVESARIYLKILMAVFPTRFSTRCWLWTRYMA